MSSSGIIPLGHGERNDYPLVAARVHYRVIDVQLFGNLAQTYVSNASQDAEICYVFPLPPDASVCSFEAVLNGTRTIKGIVKEKQVAKADYKKAVSQGKTAALLQQHNAEIFQVSLGNIRPKQTIEVRISMVSLVSQDGNIDSLRLTFPSVIAPRYGTPPIEIEDTRPSTNPLELTVAVEMTSAVRSIISPSHPIGATLGTSSTKMSEAAFDPRKAHVDFSSPTFLETDIVLVINCEGLDRPRCTVESFSPEEGSQEHTDAYALTVVPRFDLPALPRQEYIFLVDRSGSMSGSPIAGVRKALQIMLRSLPSRNTTFNILSFGSSSSSIWPSSVPYSSHSVAQASSHVDSMEADFGGTQMRAALEATFAGRNKMTGEDAVPTAVFLLTDGDAWDLAGVQKVIQAECVKAKAEKGCLRVFCLGIGGGVSKAMCDGIARAGQGTAVYVAANESPNQKLMGLLKAARGGVVEDLSIDWGAGEEQEIVDEDFEMVSGPTELSSKPEKTPAQIQMFDDTKPASSENMELGPQDIKITLPPPPRIQQAPALSSLPPFYPGVRASVFAIIKRAHTGTSALPQMVRIKGSVLGRPIILEVPVVPTTAAQPEISEHATRKVLHTLAARALIQSFEDRSPGAKSEEDKADILRLATRYGLASSQTSFIAVDEGDPEATQLGGETDIPVVGAVQPSGGRSRGSSGRGLGAGGAMRHRKVLSPPSPSSDEESETLGSQSDDAEEEMEESDDDMGFGIWDDPDAVAPAIQVRSSAAQLMRLAAPELPPPGQVPRPVWSPPTIDTIARTQEFDGSFPSCYVLFENATASGSILTLPQMLHGDSGVTSVLWSTALCVSWLERNFKDEEDVWFMIVEKANMYIVETATDVLGISERDVEGFVEKLMAEAKRRVIAVPAKGEEK